MAGYFEQVHLQQILQSVNIVDVVGQYVALTMKGKDALGLCPFHDDHKPSFHVSPSKQIYKCFSCGAGGDVFKFLMQREKLTFPEAVEMLAERAGIELPRREGPATPGRSRDRRTLLGANAWANREFRRLYDDDTLGQRARQYVQDRGITDETASRFGLGWAPAQWDTLAKAAHSQAKDITVLAELGLVMERDHGGYYDRFRERLMFPVRDAMGSIIAFGGRTLGDDPAKYLNSPESSVFSKGRGLYGIDVAKDAIVRSRTAVVVEGYTDCIMAHQCGVENVVATLGTAFTADHGRMLSRYAQRLVLVFDSDGAGQKAAERALEILFAQRLDVCLVSLPAGQDPCDFLLAQGKEAFEQLLQQAPDALAYKWEQTLWRLQQEDSVNGRQRAVDAFLRVVAQAFRAHRADAIQRGFQLNKVAKLVDQPVDLVERRLRMLEKELQRGFKRQTDRPAETPTAQRQDEFLTADGVTNAQREVLEVLLNRPDLFAQAELAIAEPDEFEDAALRQVAQQVWPYCQAGGEGPLAEMVAGCESVGLSGLMTELAWRGSCRGNYEATLTGALQKLAELKAQGQRQSLRVALGQDYGQAAQTAMLLDYQARLQAHPRHRRGEDI